MKETIKVTATDSQLFLKACDDCFIACVMLGSEKDFNIYEIEFITPFQLYSLGVKYGMGMAQQIYVK